jgi:hypothetical protein
MVWRRDKSLKPSGNCTTISQSPAHSLANVLKYTSLVSETLTEYLETVYTDRRHLKNIKIVLY